MRIATHINPRVARWVSMGKRNPFLKGASDPAFNHRMFCDCSSFHEMVKYIVKGDWCLGQAFYYQDICLIQHGGHGGSEWWVIKGDTAFESFTVHERWMNGESLLKHLKAIQKASEAECKSLEYGKYIEERPERAEVGA